MAIADEIYHSNKKPVIEIGKVVKDDYIVCYSSSLTDLMIEVNNNIKRNYTPLGGIFRDGGNNYYQAMVLKDTPYVDRGVH